MNILHNLSLHLTHVK